MKYKTKKTLKTYFQHSWKYKTQVIILFFSVVIGSVTNAIGPYIYKLFFDVIAAADDMHAVLPELYRLLFYLATVYTVGFIGWRTSTFVTSWLQTRVMADLANYCFAYLHKHSVGFFQNNFVGSLVKRVNRFYRSFERIADIITWELLPLVIELVIIIAVLLTRNTYIGLSLVIWSAIYIAINFLFSKFKLKYDIERSKQDTRVTGVLADSITNNVNIKLFSSFKRESDLFGAENEKLRKIRRWTWDLSSFFEAIQIFLMIVLEIGVMYYAVGVWADGNVTTGDLILFQSYLLRVFLKLWNFGKIIRDYYESIADAEEMTTILDTPHGIKDLPGAKHVKSGEGHIIFDNVDFNYHKTRSIIKKLNLEINPGERIALVGPSGAGKSTIVKLLLRTVETTGGEIIIDGNNISHLAQDSLHDMISMVPQDPILFHRTLEENIKYGKPRATKKEMLHAAKAAHCHEFITNFPQEYKTFVGERGVKLSGGERQRVAIARAILKNSPILVLDEATSSLDSESEALIQDALDTLMKGKTSIVIAHRLSTIMKMDRIIVLEAGKIKEMGTHEELLKQKGLYSKLWSYQAGGFVE